MIRFVVARYENDSYETMLGTCLQEENQVHVFNEDVSGLFKKYNLGIKSHISSGLQDNDIIVFCHADVKILDPNFKEKLEYAFESIPALGLAGVIGSTQIHETGGWWLCDHSLHRGHLLQHGENGEVFELSRRPGNYMNLAGVDGLIMFVRGSVAKAIPFDEQTYGDAYDFYDLDYSLSCLENGVRVGVLDIDVEHKSAGTGIYKDSWVINKEKFLNKWKSKSYVFPIASK